MSGLYSSYKASAMGNGAHSFINLFDTDTIHVGLVNDTDDYTFSAAHQDWDDIATYTLAACYGGEGTVVLPIANRTTVDGVWDCTSDITFIDVEIDVAKVVDSTIHFKSTGIIGNDAVICHHDGFTLVTPNGGDIVIQYHGSGIFTF